MIEHTHDVAPRLCAAGAGRPLPSAHYITPINSVMLIGGDGRLYQFCDAKCATRFLVWLDQQSEGGA